MGRVRPKSRVLVAFAWLVDPPNRGSGDSWATQPGVENEGSSRFTTLPKPATLGSSLNVFSLVLNSVKCSSSLSPYSNVQVYKYGGGFDEPKFWALWEWTCVCECAISVYSMFTSSEDLFPTEKGSATTFSKASCFYKVSFTLWRPRPL